jgi:predicted dehydrogenase
MTTRLNRRYFLMGTLGAATLGRSIARAAQADKVRIGVIGCGGQGEFSWSSVADEDVRVLCDVDLAHTGRAAARFPKAQVVQDFRKVLDRDDIDAVTVATPDHWHALITNWALESGKHVYCEKPLTHSVYEARTVAETAKRKNLVTQMGTQIHAGGNYRRVVELIQADAIGPISRVDVWCEKQPSPGKLSAGSPPPSTLDYDLWVGPAPFRPYDPAVLPFNWRWWWEFGGGVLADMGCHYTDLAHWALDLRSPVKVSAKGSQFPDSDNKVPVEMEVHFHHAAKGKRPPVEVVWWHGIIGPRDEAGKPRELFGYHSGVLFHGEKGQLLADYSRHKLLPEDRFADFKAPSPTIPDSVGHHREWLNAIKDGGPTTCNFDYSGQLSETILLGNVAYRLGQEIEWDSERLRVKNAKEKDWKPLIRRDYRGDWKLKP